MLQDELDTLRRENEEVKSRNASLECTIDEMDDTIAELRFENSALRRNNRPSSADGDSMIADPMNENYEIKAQNESMQLMIEDMENIIMKLEKKNQALENAQNDSTDPADDDMKTKMDNLEKENKGLRFNLDKVMNETLDSHQDQMLLIKEYEDKLEGMETRLNNAYAQLDHCKPQLGSKKVSKELKKTAKSKSAKSWLKKFFKKRTENKEPKN